MPVRGTQRINHLERNIWYELSQRSTPVPYKRNILLLVPPAIVTFTIVQTVC